MTKEFSVTPQPKYLGALADTSDAEQYRQAIAESMKVLEARANPQLNLARVAAGFLKPTRTGSFGESLGYAEEEMAKEQEQREKEALPIAQMRAALAGQKYEMSRKADAMKMASSMLGVSPGAASNAITSGGIPISTLLSMDPSKISALLLMDKDMGMALKEGYDLAIKARQSAIDDAKAGISLGEIEAKYPGVLKTIPKSILNPSAGTYGEIKTAPSATAPAVPVPSRAATSQDTLGQPSQSAGTTADDLAERSETPPTTTTQSQTTQQPTGGVPQVTSPQLGLAAMQEVLKNMSEEEIKGWNKKAEDIRSINPTTQAVTFREMQQVAKYLTDPRNSKVVGALQQHDPNTGEAYWNSFLTGLNTGIQTGKFGGGGINLPVESMAQTANLDQRERIVLAEINRITKKALISSITESGKALGINPTDADAALYAGTQASVSNLAPNIIYWAQQRAAQAEYKQFLYNKYKSYAPGKHPALFFADPKSGFDEAHNMYLNRMDNIKAPGM